MAEPEPAGVGRADGELEPMAVDGFGLDCYPYGFSPLLLFAESSYFDKGFSNYNSVAQFFAPALDVDMLANVLYDRKNMLYEELLEHVATNCMLVTCCIDAHFTAFQVLPGRSLIYYDPLKASLSHVSGSGFDRLAGFLLLKCNYGDSQHMQDNKDYYTGSDSNPKRRLLYQMWDRINKLDVGSLGGVGWTQIPMNLDRYLLINNARNPTLMSTQMTGNTCYFQTYLFGVLCKVGSPALRRSSIELQNVDKLAEATKSISCFLLQFFVEEQGQVMRPLTNSNFVVDFFRYTGAPYYDAMTKYLRYLGVDVPDYQLQYRRTMAWFEKTKTLHSYSKFTLSGAMPSTINSKSLQPVLGTNDAAYKLARSNYYKYRAANLMFGFNTGIMLTLTSFCEFNALRKNQLLAFYGAEELQPLFRRCRSVLNTNKYRDYYFMAQFEVGQPELVDLHHYTYLLQSICIASLCVSFCVSMYVLPLSASLYVSLCVPTCYIYTGRSRYLQDMCSILSATRSDGMDLVHRVNAYLADHIYFSTQSRSSYDKFLTPDEFRASRKYYEFFLSNFMSVAWHQELVGLGFPDVNPKEKEINSLNQTVFYLQTLMSSQAYRMEFEFEKECINNMARMTLRKYGARFDGTQGLKQKYRVSVKIGHGFTYSKYNTLMHFLSVVGCYWQNPDLNNIQVFGKDIRALLAISCQKIFFEEGQTWYHYGPMETGYRSELDLALATSLGYANPTVSMESRTETNQLVLTDRVYEYNYLKGILHEMFTRAHGVRIKSDNAVLNLSLLSLLLDFGLYEEHAHLLNLPFLHRMHNLHNKRQLQVEVATLIHEFDRKNRTDTVTRLKLEELIFEASYKFVVNKGFPVYSPQNELIQELSADPAYQQHLLLCKINMSLCQINKSVEVDYYKVRCNGEFRTIIPQSFSKSTGEYLEQITKRYAFSEHGGVINYDQLALFDIRPEQPDIHLHTIRFDSATDVQSMVKYMEIKNAFQAVDSDRNFLVFIADNALQVEVLAGGGVAISINKTPVQIATIFFNEAFSFVPCFKYADSEDVILFASPNIHYLVDNGGQFCTDYYGMKHELIECITSEEVYVDLNDEHVFKTFKLSELRSESKTVVHAPDFLLQVPSRQQLINLLDFAIYVRNVSLFILVLFYLRRSSVFLDYIQKEGGHREQITKITGPWWEAILYVHNQTQNAHYEQIFQKQFFDLNQHEALPLTEFIEKLCENFTKYQPLTDDGQYQIVPTDKQKAFLQRIICAEECFHFSEVGSGKTKVILPLLCQTFLSNNAEAHEHFARGGQSKHVLVVLVPEHLVQDAKAQVFRYCLNLNFREEYRIYDDIFALLHDKVELGSAQPRYSYDRSHKTAGPPPKKIFVTSFNMFKKALTYDAICKKVWPHRESILVVTDEVDDFLDRDKLVFNICSNKGNDLDRPTLELYFEISRAAYNGEPCPHELVASSDNPVYWKQLHDKCCAIHAEIQDASRSVNKSFGIFNEQTLRHCSTNIAHDVEGYKSLIARPYESVNRAMPGSYYSDVERTIYLTWVILTEDIAKYDELFQEERKFISFEYWSQHVSQLDFDDLVYGHERLSDLVTKMPETKEGLLRFLYQVILRRMEIRDKSRSVNSVDVVFNFDCIGFTGTPFIDNYPTFAYIRSQREDKIPDMIDRSFYAYSSEELPTTEFQSRFAAFQGQNSHVLMDYVPSDFVKTAAAEGDEMAILEGIFASEQATAAAAAADGGCGFNVLVDLCGIFKRSSIHDVRDRVLKYFGPDRFHFVYHIDQVDSSDRVLSIDSDNDVQFDEEFYKHLCKTYGARLREKVFFFVDNRNVIGKDIPFQFVYQRRFGQPLFSKNVVLAHDVDDFSKIWQAMGRSRTMNETRFSVYKSDIPEEMLAEQAHKGLQDIKLQTFTRHLYVHNCDCKMAGNLSSIYQTLLALLNLAQQRFYHMDEIVNTFLLKMDRTIERKVRRHEDELAHRVLGTPVPSRILEHILADKFMRSSVAAVAAAELTKPMVEELLRHVVQQKFEQREPSGDVHDDFIRFLSGDQVSLMEISYTKQQQKQKQKQQNKNQDSDTMDVFDRPNQVELSAKIDNYFDYILTPESDVFKVRLNLPLTVPILTLTYELDGSPRCINVYPTLQFLYSHHIYGKYVTRDVKDELDRYDDAGSVCARFLQVTSEAALAAATSSAQDEDAEDVFWIGATVRCHGLVSTGQQYNGMEGTITGSGKEGRWGVQLQGQLKPIAFRPETLELLQAQPSPSRKSTDAVQQLRVR